MTDDQARFGRGESSGLRVFVGVPPFEPTVESVVDGVRFGSPIKTCDVGRPGEQEITLSSGQPALWLDCEEPERASILIVGDDPTQPDATVVVVTEPDDPAHDRVVESVSLGDGGVDHAGGEARVTDDSDRLSVEIPPGWDWDGAPTSAGQPMVGATLGAAGDALDVPTIQFFTLPVANDAAEALDQLLDAFGFENACEALLLEPDTVGGISGERADGLLCGPNQLAVAAFVGPIDDGSGETIVFLMSAEQGTEPTPGAVLATIEIN